MAAGRPAMFPLFRQNGLPWRQWPARLPPKSSPGRSRRAYDQEALFIFLGAHDTSAEKTTCACGRAVLGTGTVVCGWWVGVHESAPRCGGKAPPACAEVR